MCCDLLPVCSRFEQEVNCPPVYRRLLEAVGTNYPTAAFLGPAYAPLLTALIEQQLHIGPSEAEEMHCGFPLLHALVQECSWDSIPSDLAPMLEHLVSRACAPNSTTSVRLPTPAAKIPVSTMMLASLSHTCVTQHNHCLLVDP